MPASLVFVIGPTNVGKSTLLERVKAASLEKVGLVEVGKIMRAKYPPEYFKGLGAPEHTQIEAWTLMVNGVSTHHREGCTLILVDGQPRNMKQCYDILSMYPKDGRFTTRFLHLWAPAAVREERARSRDHNNPAKLELSLSRMHNDPIELYEIYTSLHLTVPQLVHTVDTSVAGFDPVQCVRQIVGDNVF